MATVNIMKNTRSQTRAGLAFILSYCKREAKTQHEDRRLVTGVNCVAEYAYREMMNTKLQYGKTDGRMFYHLVQSFSPDERITPQRAHELAIKLAEQKFSGFEVLVATHVDKHHIHSHFVVNSVGCESGRKLHADKDFIPKLREASDRLCIEFGLSVVNGKKKDKQAEQMSAREYRAADRGESWKMRLIVTIEEAMAAARSRDEFIHKMEAEGYGVRWTAERKYITYTTPDGQKCRDNKLHEEKFLKENMENEFGIRNEIFFGAESSCEEKHTDGGTGAALRSGNGTQLESDDRYAESAARDAVKADGYGGSAFNEGRAEGATAMADTTPDGAYGEQLFDNERVSDGDEAGGSGIHRLDENGTLGYVETGWEHERELLAGALSDEGYDEEVYAEDILDNDHPFGDNGHLLSDSAYLIADLSNLLDEDRRIEDSTTMPKQRKEKKRNQSHGPNMGGM